MVLKIVRALVRYRWATLFFIVVSMGLSAREARTIQVRFQYRDFFDYPSNPRLPLLTRYTADFGDPGGYVVLLVEAHDVFAPEVLRYVSDITRELQAFPEFSSVKSLANASCIRAQRGGVESGPVMNHVPSTPEESWDLRRTALQCTMLVRHVVSADATATAVLAEMRVPSVFATIEEERTASGIAQSVVRDHPPPDGVRVRVTGAPQVEVATSTSLARDQATFMPCVLLIIVVALALTFSSVQGVVLPLCAVIVSLVWTAGIYSLFHRPIDIIGSVFPTILVVYGVVDPIFVYTRYLTKLDLGRVPRVAIFEALSELLVPCFLTSLTTALGFASFATATLPSIRNFGLIVAIGVSLSFVTTITVLPVLLALLPPPKRKQTSTRLSALVDAALVRYWQVIRRRRGAVLAVAIGVLALGAVAGRGVGIVNEYTGVLPGGSAKDGVRALERKLSGVVRLVVYLEGPAGSMKRPDVLRAIAEVDRLAEQRPEVDSSISLADLVADANQAFEGGDPNEHRVPDSAALIAQYLAFTDPSDRADFVSDDYSRSHIRILVTDRGSRAIRELGDALEQHIASRFARLGVRASLTGRSVVAYAEADRVVAEILWSFVGAYAIIVLAEWAAFRSLRVALLSIVPNLVPVAACFITMRLFDLHLRLDNAIVLCVSIGGLFNTTIHIVARILRQLRAGATDPDAIVEQSLRIVGPPSLYTAAILSAGFAVFGFSSFPGVQAFGLLTMVTLVVGFLSDASVTSTLMRSAFGWKSAMLAALPGTDVSGGAVPASMAEGLSRRTS
ncbi:MAG: MMPL family transporter [Polyangiaceae bacterium]|jgi:predicted RND superfamily exporter protein